MTLYPHDGTETINVGTSTANATPIAKRRVWGARILVPASSPLNGLAVKFYERRTGGTTWFECLDDNDSAISFTAASLKSRPLPYSLHASHEICMVASALGAPAPIQFVSIEGQERP